MFRTVLKGHNKFHRELLRPTAVETSSVREIIDAARGGDLWSVTHIQPNDAVHNSKAIAGSIGSSLFLQQLWQVLEFLDWRRNVYAQYSSCGECPSNIPHKEHAEVARRIQALWAITEAVEPIFEQEFQKRFPTLRGKKDFFVRQNWQVEWWSGFEQKSAA